MPIVLWNLRVIFLGLSLWMAPLPCYAVGGGVLNHPTEQFSTDIPEQPHHKVRAAVSLQLILFRLNTVHDKYKVVPVLVENHTRDPITLSRSEDAFVALFDERSVPGILQLSHVDRNFWDSLDSEMRKMLAYPEEIGPGDGVMLYVFIPQSDAPNIPTGFDYTIKSLDRTLKLRIPRPAMAQ
jgi:hypothetical protein